MKPVFRNLMLSALSTVIVWGFSAPVFSQPYVPPSVKRPVTKPKAGPMPVVYGGNATEKFIKVDSAINLSLCVSMGTIKVNGWKRNEVRVLVENGHKFSFVVRDKSPKTGDPIWMKVVNADSKKHTECLAASEIEIDLPTGATIGIAGREISTKIDSVKKAEVKTAGGGISLRNVSSGIFASSGQGDVMVESSSGPMDLGSTTGNIIVFDAGPTEIGEGFVAKTNSGTVSMQNLMYRQVEVRSTSGSVLYNGVIRPGGSYNLNTSVGSIRMALPADSACQLSATFRSGSFKSELPIKYQTEDVGAGPIKTIVGTIGKGPEATVRLTTNHGSINIRKL